MRRRAAHQPSRKSLAAHWASLNTCRLIGGRTFRVSIANFLGGNNRILREKSILFSFTLAGFSVIVVKAAVLAASKKSFGGAHHAPKSPFMGSASLPYSQLFSEKAVQNPRLQAFSGRRHDLPKPRRNPWNRRLHFLQQRRLR